MLADELAEGGTVAGPTDLDPYLPAAFDGTENKSLVPFVTLPISAGFATELVCCGPTSSNLQPSAASGSQGCCKNMTTGVASCAPQRLRVARKMPEFVNCASGTAGPKQLFERPDF